MKKLLSTKFVLMIGALFVFSLACTDLTERTPSSLTSLESEEEFISALGEAYAVLGGDPGWTSHGGFFALSQISTDETVIPRRGGDWFDGGIWIDTHRHTIDVDHDPTNSAWTYLFSGVNATSRIAAQFEQLRDDGAVDAELANNFIAEAKVLRAFYYFFLLDAFGNVPIIEDFAAVEGNPPNNTDFDAGRAELFDFIEAELLENVPLLDDDVAGAYGRINQYSGHFLLAKLYLNSEVYTGTERWADAGEQLDIIIDSGEFSLETNYFNNFSVDNSGASETIFAIPYDEVFNPGFNWHQMTLHYEQQAQFNFQDQPWNGYATLAEFYNSFDDDDLRREGLMSGVQTLPSGEEIIDPGSPGDPVLDLMPEIPALNMESPDEYPTYRLAGARFAKFEYEQGATPNLNNDFPVMRYADVILMKAEVELRTGNVATGQMYFDMIRQGNRVGNVGTLPLNEENLLAERGRELYMEIWRRQDMIRFPGEEAETRYNDSWWEKSVSEAYRNVFPIPEDQINANPNLNQNPGY